MTEHESALIARLMNGDIGAFDELIPNAPNELREKVEFIVKNSNNPFVALLTALTPQSCTKKLHYDLSLVKYEMVLERLLERGEISLSENPSFEDKLRILKKVEKEIEHANLTD